MHLLKLFHNHHRRARLQLVRIQYILGRFHFDWHAPVDQHRSVPCDGGLLNVFLGNVNVDGHQFVDDLELELIKFLGLKMAYCFAGFHLDGWGLEERSVGDCVEDGIAEDQIGMD